MPRSRLFAAALVACFLLLLSPNALAEYIEFDVWHRLGNDDEAPSSKWRPAGTLSGDVDTEALVDAAAAALRGGGGRVSPPKASSPVLTLARDETNAFTAEEERKAAERGQGYSIKLVRKPADRSLASSPKSKKKSTSRALFTSAPPHCTAAALSGALPLKLDGNLPSSSTFKNGGGDGGIRVTGVSFDFYGGGCRKGSSGGKGGKQPQSQQRVPLWLPAAAPPLLPPPPPPAAAAKKAAAAAAAQAQAEAARRRAAASGEGGDSTAAAPPVEDNRTWLQKNWVYALPMFMMAMNVMNAVAGPPPPPPQQRGRQGGQAAAAGAAAAVAGAAAAGGVGGRGDGGGVASLD